SEGAPDREDAIDGTWHGDQARCPDGGDRWHAGPLPHTAAVLELLRAGDRHTQLIRLGTRAERRLGAEGCLPDARPEPEPAATAESCVQGCCDDSYPATRRPPAKPGLPANAPGRHQAEPGEADARAAHRRCGAVHVEHKEAYDPTRIANRSSR